MNVDDLLQERAELVLSNDEELDSAERANLTLYRQLFSILEEEPSFRLPPDFAERVAEQVRLRQATDWAADWLPLWGLVVLTGLYVWAVPTVREALARTA